MKLNRLSIWLIVTVLSAAFWNCQDHLNPDAPRYRLKRAVQQGNRFYSSTVYTYNSANKLASYINKLGAESQEGRVTTLNYDAQGRVTTADRPAIPNSTPTSKDTYEYDSDGNLSLIRNFVANPAGDLVLSATTAIEYDADKQPKKSVRTSFLPTGNYVETNVYTVAGGNVIQIERSVSPSVGQLADPILTFQYDNKPNPFRGLIGFPSVGPTLYNKNNVNSPEDQLSYDNNELLKSVRSNYKADSQFQSTTTYEYETY